MTTGDDRHEPSTPDDREARGEDALDESLEESFPASDPPERTQPHR